MLPKLNLAVFIEKLQMKLEKAFLDKYVFHGLTDLNSGFDVKTIRYFSKAEFAIVLQRVEKLGIGIYGIEPWRNGQYYDVKTCEDFDCKPTDSRWYKKAFNDFASAGVELQYSATYYIPKNLLNNE